MDNSNIKVYLGISGALIVLLILVIVIPFAKNPNSLTPNSLTPSPSSLFPTSVATDSTDSTDLPAEASAKAGLTVPATFTGALDEPLPQTIIDTSNQKKDLQSKVPLNLTSFSIDFDYSNDKFIVTLKDPKDQSTKEFESWRAANYPGLTSEQFTIK